MADLIELETKRLRLRQWRLVDREFFAALNSDPRVMAFFPSLLVRADSDALADRCQSIIEERGWGFWAVEIKTTQEVMREHFRWLKGEDKLSSFESSPGKLRYFCSVCGSHPVAECINQPHVIVRLATLDEDPGITPQMHIRTSHDVPWLQHEGIPTYPEWQPERK